MRTEVSWVGEIHRRAMDDVVANRAQWLAGAGAREDRVCSAITRLMLKYSPEIETYAGGFASQAQRAAYVRQVVSGVRQCEGVQPMNVFSTPGALLAPLALSAAQATDSVTGAFQQYTDAMPDAVHATTGTPTQVSAAVYTIVAAADNAGVSDADLYVVVAAAEDAVSSAEGWYAEQQSGGLPNCDNDPEHPACVEPMSAFRVIPLLAAIGGADVIGCVANAASGYLGGTRDKWAIAGMCGWGSVGASGAFFLALPI